MQNKIIETCIIGKDGRLLLPADRVRQFTNAHKGRRIIATFEVVPAEQSEAQRAYYYNYVVPTVRDALWEQGTRLTDDAVDMFLVSEFPDNGNKDRAREFDKDTMTEFIFWLQEYAIENLDVYVEDPTLIAGQKRG